MPTLSEWVNEALFNPRSSVINHPTNEPILFICEYYRAVTTYVCGMQIIGLLRLDYIGYQELIQPTLNTITKAMLGSQAKDSIRKALLELHGNDWLDSRIYTPVEIKDLLCEKQPQYLSIGGLQCQWCNGRTIALQEHHYPISKSKGGTEVVSICASCHFEFHQLLSVARYAPSDKLIQFFETQITLLAGGVK